MRSEDRRDQVRLLDAAHEADFKSNLEKFEGRTSWPYLDGASPGNVTIGVGYLITTLEIFRSLPWVCGPPSTTTENDWLTIRHAVPGLMAPAYKSLTTVRLSNPAINVLLDARIDEMERGLLSMIPAVSVMPQPVRQGLCDMALNLGVGRLDRDFFDPGCKFGPALYRGDWAAAATESKRKEFPEPSGIQPARNAYVHDLILRAA